MTRGEFLLRLERGLGKIPAAERGPILSDYESHFVEGTAAGRSEDDISTSLGSPARLAAELRLVYETQREGRSPVSLRALPSLVALAFLLGAAWLPLLAGVLTVIVLISAGAVAIVYGCFTLIVESFDAPLGGFVAVLLRALGWLSAGVGAFAISSVSVNALARVFARLQRLNRRTPRPSTEVSS